MKALLCKSFGPPETLVLEDMAAPAMGEDEVRVAVSYAGLNFFDLLIIKNKYQVKPPLPFSPGGEFAGTVAAVGRNVSGFKPGDRVAGFSGFGAARAELVTTTDKLIHIPTGLSEEKAAGLIVTYATSLHALKQRARLAKGETLAVLGASGGVGIAAVELAHAHGLRVIGSGGTEIGRAHV